MVNGTQDTDKETNVNGNSQSFSNADMLGIAQNMRGKRFDAIQEMLTGSSEPADYLARTRFTEREIKTMGRMQARRASFVSGFTDPVNQIEFLANSRISLGGASRREAERMYGAQRSHMERMNSPFGGFAERSKDIEKNEIAGK